MRSTSKNLFTLSPNLCAEDRFTAHLCCLIELEPTIGQRLVDRFAELTAIPRAKFHSIVDHPVVTKGERPDCLIRTDRYDIIVEHKLNSGLGQRQLERYLSQVGPNAYLALVSTDHQAIPATVDMSSRYLSPKSKTAISHLLWRDFYPIIKDHPSRLAKQFSEYMRTLGMNPFDWDSKGDPFIDPKAADAFRELY